MLLGNCFDKPNQTRHLALAVCDVVNAPFRPSALSLSTFSDSESDTMASGQVDLAAAAEAIKALPAALR